MSAKWHKTNSTKGWIPSPSEPTGNKTAMIQDIEVSVDVDKYPVYYLVHRKNEKDSEPVAMVVIGSEAEDVGYPMSVAVFMRKNYNMKRIGQAEAETYEVFDVAPIFNPKQFGEFLAKESEEIARSFSETGIKERHGVVKKGKAVFDLTTKVTPNELKPPRG